MRIVEIVNNPKKEFCDTCGRLAKYMSFDDHRDTCKAFCENHLPRRAA